MTEATNNTKFQVLTGLVPPARKSPIGVKRGPGEFKLALAALEIGHGFEYQAEGSQRSQYSKVARKDWAPKKFQVWEKRDEQGNIVPGTFVVFRHPDLTDAELAQMAAEEAKAAERAAAKKAAAAAKAEAGAPAQADAQGDDFANGAEVQ